MEARAQRQLAGFPLADAWLSRFPLQPVRLSNGEVLPSQMQGMNWKNRGIIGLVCPEPFLAHVPPGHDLALLQQGNRSKAVLSIYFNSMDSNVGPLSEFVLSLAVVPVGSALSGQFAWRNPFSVVAPLLAGAKTWIFKLVLSAEQRAAERINRDCRGWDAVRGRLDFQLGCSLSQASVGDSLGQSIAEVRIGPVNHWNTVLELFAFMEALRAARLAFPRARAVTAIPIVSGKAEGGPELRESTMLIKGELLYRRFAPSGDRIRFGTHSELGTLLASAGFEPSLVACGNDLKVATY